MRTSISGLISLVNNHGYSRAQQLTKELLYACHVPQLNLQSVVKIDLKCVVLYTMS